LLGSLLAYVPVFEAGDVINSNFMQGPRLPSQAATRASPLLAGSNILLVTVMHKRLTKQSRF